MARSKNRKRKRRSFFQRLVFITSWGLGIGIVSVIALMFIYGMRSSSFDLDEVAEIPMGATIYDSSGREITTLRGGGRLVEREEIPEFLIDCLLAREDAKFYEHGGIDWKGLVRATVRNVKDMSFTQGASTLSMQLARNTFEIRAKSIDRKLLEMALTRRIENRYSKNEILTHYLNRIYFGSGCYGIDAAARTYFGRKVSRLTKGQCATLIGIIRGPHVFSPHRNLEGALNQRNQVLNRLVATEKLSREEADKIAREDIRLEKKSPDDGDRTYAVQAVRRHLNELADDSAISSGGLKVLTSIDLALQSEVDAFIDSAFRLLQAPSQKDPTDDLQCAAVVIDLKNGGIVALTGGRDFSKSKFNRALDARRSLGPAFEIFLNALARERGSLPIKGRPLQTGKALGRAQADSLLARLALEPSSMSDAEFFRGGIMVSPLRIAGALATLAAAGQKPRTWFISQVKTSSGQSIFTNRAQFTPAISPSSASEGLMTMGRDGAFVRATPNHHDLWALAVDKSHAMVLWFGYDSPRRIEKGSIVSKQLETSLRQTLKRL